MTEIPRFLVALLILFVGSAVLALFMGGLAFPAAGLAAGIAIWTIPGKKKTGA